MSRHREVPTASSRPSAFERFSAAATATTGRSGTFLVACLLIVAWGASGPLFGFSQVWQLVINTGTTIVTFLMVFLIQHTQNKDSVAIHLKLNELVASHAHASNRLIAVEELSDEELALLREFYARLAARAQQEGGVRRSHSLDEVEGQHARKHARRERALE